MSENTSKFTLHNWKVVVENQTRYDSFTGQKTERNEIWIKPINGEHVALICGAYGVIPLDERLKVANIVAAAPELFEALVAVLEEDSGLMSVPKIEAVLKKARGEV